MELPLIQLQNGMRNHEENRDWIETLGGGDTIEGDNEPGTLKIPWYEITLLYTKGIGIITKILR